MTDKEKGGGVGKKNYVVGMLVLKETQQKLAYEAMP